MNPISKENTERYPISNASRSGGCMPEEEIRECLCIKDPRNPLHSEVYTEYEADEIPPPRVGCYCDNCFTGKDKLAVELLRVTEG